EHDGLYGDIADRERSAAASVAVHLRKDHAGQAELFVKLVGRVDGVLSGHGIGNKQDLLRIEQPLQALHLFHQLIVDVQTSGSIDDQHIAAGDRRLAPSFLSKTLNDGGVRLSIDLALIKVGADSFPNYLELLAGSRTVDVH